MNKRKVMLVDPGLAFSEGGTRHSIRQTPHIGLCFLAMAIKDLAHVIILDMPLMGLKETQFVKELQKLADNDIVGITSATFNIYEAVRAAELVKETNPSLVTVLGGPHVNAYPEHVFQLTDKVDFIIRGEGEKAFRTFVVEYGGQGFSYDMPGLGYVNQNGPVINETGNIYDNLDDLPLWDWGFLGLQNYWKRYSLKFDSMELTAPISTIRGCAFRCSFCDPGNLTSKVRYQSAQRVFDEIVNAHKNFNIRYFYITDSVMTIPRSRFLKLCALLKQSQLASEISLIGQANVNAIDEELLDAFKEAGAEYVFYGIESGNNEVLRNNGKPITRKRIRRMVSHAHDIGLYPRGSFILGLPFDTEKTVRETIEFSRSLKLHTANYFLLDLYPHTRAKEMAVRGDAGFETLSDNFDWNSYIPSRGQADFKVNDLTPQKLQDLLAYARSFEEMDSEVKEVSLRQKMAEFIYYADNGQLDIEIGKRRYKQICKLAENNNLKNDPAFQTRLKKIENQLKYDLTSEYRKL